MPADLSREEKGAYTAGRILPCLYAWPSRRGIIRQGWYAGFVPLRVFSIVNAKDASIWTAFYFLFPKKALSKKKMKQPWKTCHLFLLVREHPPLTGTANVCALIQCYTEPVFLPVYNTVCKARLKKHLSHFPPRNKYQLAHIEKYIAIPHAFHYLNDTSVFI